MPENPLHYCHSNRSSELKMFRVINFLTIKVSPFFCCCCYQCRNNFNNKRVCFKVIQHPDSALSLLCSTFKHGRTQYPGVFFFHSNFDFQLCAMLVDFEYRDLTYAHRATVDSAENSWINNESLVPFSVCPAALIRPLNSKLEHTLERRRKEMSSFAVVRFLKRQHACRKQAIGYFTIVCVLYIRRWTKLTLFYTRP